MPVRGFKNIVLFAVIAAAFSLAACSMDTESNVITAREKVELRQENAAIRMPTASINDATLAGLADQYRRSGMGRMEITVTYDPKSKTNTAMNAAGQAARIASYLKRKTGAEVSSDILPAVKAGGNSETLVTYMAYTAHAPDCDSMGGVDGTRTHINSDYKYGCTIESQLSRQIANPKDLAGRDGIAAGDGRRQSNIVDVYRTGEPNSQLEGESASQ